MARSKLILGEFLPYQLSTTSNAVSEFIARSYRGRFGLKIPEWRVMAVLGERASATQRELVAATQVLREIDVVAEHLGQLDDGAVVEPGFLSRSEQRADDQATGDAQALLDRAFDGALADP